MSVNNILNTKFCFITALTSVGNVKGAWGDNHTVRL